ncbi:MAG: hypothetical protein U5K69_09290 [Balneolaceae bacterium]|nr:hypothetical protein [Balneolaceae bacterium]
MQRIAEEARVQIQGFDTGRMDSGIDLASESSIPVEKPNVALMVDSPFSSYTAGQIWFLFDQWTDFGISRIRSDALDNIDLQEYDVLVLPGARGGYSSVLDSTMMDRLKDWVQRGGTLVATEDAAEFVTKGASGFTKVEMVKEETEENGEEKIDPEAFTPYTAREDICGIETRNCPGRLFKGHIDITNPVAFGIPERIYSLKFSDEALKPSPDWQLVGYYDKDPQSVMAAGYASEANREQAAGNGFAGVQEMGEGKVIFLLDNTQYRMFWVGPARMMQNAVMLLHDM